MSLGSAVSPAVTWAPSGRRAQQARETPSSPLPIPPEPGLRGPRSPAAARPLLARWSFLSRFMNNSHSETGDPLGAASQPRLRTPDGRDGADAAGAGVLRWRVLCEPSRHTLPGHGALGAGPWGTRGVSHAAPPQASPAAFTSAHGPSRARPPPCPHPVCTGQTRLPALLRPHPALPRGWRRPCGLGTELKGGACGVEEGGSLTTPLCLSTAQSVLC